MLPFTQKLQFYHILHRSGYLQEFPANICLFPEIVVIDLSLNSITNIQNIDEKCLPILNELYLSYNKISLILTSTFSNLKFLTKLDLSNNEIVRIESGTFGDLGGALFTILLRKNFLEEIDIIDVLRELLRGP